MIEHLVIIKVTVASDDARITEMIRKIKDLGNHISEIKEISAGRNFSDRSKGFEVGVRVLLDNRDHIEVYRNHPAHVTVLNDYIKPILSEIIVIDFEF